MKHTLQYNDDKQLLIQTINGVYTTDESKQLEQQYNELLEGKPYRQIIVDLRNAGKMESRETRSIINKMLNAAHITHVALIGANSAQRMIAKVLMKLGSLKAESNFFKNMDDAINWIEKRRK
ncbi:MAG: STAS/SEC14 domain-containing protein [Bacteroidales bacterium]|nr:STAS/SEC14 domain-containing protein [Bacteroidales bacterium]